MELIPFWPAVTLDTQCIAALIQLIWALRQLRPACTRSEGFLKGQQQIESKTLDTFKGESLVSTIGQAID